MIDKECKETIYLTPEKILVPVRDYFGGQIRLDPATQPENPTSANLFYTGTPHDGLELPWMDKTFVNPPYGRVLQDWCRKIDSESQKNLGIVALLPGQRFETKYWQKHILNDRLSAIVLILGRVPFLRPDGSPAKSNPYGSMLYVYNDDPEQVEKHFGHLGKILCLQ